MHKLSIAILLLWLALLSTTTTWAIDSEPLLEPDEAFEFSAKLEDSNKLLLSWEIADGYYLYRHKIKFASLTPDVQTGEPVFPAGQSKQDQHFGNVVVYRDQLDVELPIQHQLSTAVKLELEVTFQGCADIGVCYMPIQKVITFDLPVRVVTSQSGASPPGQSGLFSSEQDSIAASLGTSSVWLVILSFMGFGLLLAFTPCILPVIPIISGIVVGQRKQLTTRRAFSLSLSYVLASALTYTVFGVLAAQFGSNLQAFFQMPWVIMLISGLFTLLALSLFGVFSLQMPSSIQSKINTLSAKQQGGHLLGAAAMGMLSTLVVGPCVTPPLAGVLLYIGQSGDPMLGGLALFSLGLGMGIPLLIIGTSAGKLLPKTGAWMNVTKALFGLGLLAVAVYLLGRILPPSATELLWAALFVGPLLYLFYIKHWRRTAWTGALVGIILIIVFVGYQRDLVQLLCNTADACQPQATLAFEKINTIEEFQRKLGDAHKERKWVVMDVYADWCVSCLELERDTFSDPRVRTVLANTTLLKADVTQNLATDQSLLKQFELIGPPAILFFGPDQQERITYRVVGYVGADQFLDITKRLFGDGLT